MITFIPSPTGVQLIGLLISIVLPAVVALITNRMASSGLKSIALLLLAAVTGFGTELLDAAQSNTAFDVGAALASWLTAFVIAVVTHYGLLKPSGVTGSSGAIATSVPGGLGTADPDKHSAAAIIARIKAEKR